MSNNPTTVALGCGVTIDLPDDVLAAASAITDYQLARPIDDGITQTFIHRNPPAPTGYSKRDARVWATWSSETYTVIEAALSAAGADFHTVGGKTIKLYSAPTPELAELVDWLSILASFAVEKAAAENPGALPSYDGLDALEVAR